MASGGLELADVFRRCGLRFRQAQGRALSSSHRRVMTAIESCRTAVLGGHVDRCDSCGLQLVSYNSCRNRHCPKCQGQARKKWLADRQSELLAVPYFHVIFTVPDTVAEVAFQNRRTVYNILFAVAAQTLQTIARDPKHLGAHIGFLAVLHTWGQNLLHHPHVHCVVPGGGLSSDRSRWISSRSTFFLSVRVLSRLFRRLFLTRLQQTFRSGRLQLTGALAPLAEPKAFDAFISQARKLKWVVYAKAPFGGPEQVLRYVGGYTHRIAFSNRRLLDIDADKISFLWRDYRDGNRQKVMTLDANEFIRRFLIHVLPDGFGRIRHFGLLANRHRKRNLALCRQLLAEAPQTSVNARHHTPAATAPAAPEASPPQPLVCPECRQGLLHRFLLAPSPPPARIDSS